MGFEWNADGKREVVALCRELTGSSYVLSNRKDLVSFRVVSPPTGKLLGGGTSPGQDPATSQKH